jgi:hypothetical protein
MPEIHNLVPGGQLYPGDKTVYFSTGFSTPVEKYFPAAKNNTDPAARGKTKCQDFAWSRDLLLTTDGER